MRLESVSLETHILEAADQIDSAAEQFLTEMGALLAADAAAMSPVDEGQLKGSWDYVVDIAEHSVTVGSSLENAVWNEFGTGMHAANGDGRMSPWYVPVAGYTGSKKPSYKGKVTVVYGKNGVQYYKTDGKAAQHTLQHVADQDLPKAEKRLAALLKRGLS